jgi:tetratricopeptide (TPR) repeat protein
MSNMMGQPARRKTMERRALLGVVVLGVLLTSSPAWAGTEADQGKVLYDAGQYEPARQIFESILAGEEDDEDALYYLGKIYFDHSDLDGAKDYLENLVDLRPDNAEYQLALGNVYGQKARTSGFFISKKKWAGRWKDRLELAFELDSNNVEVREWLAGYLLNAPGIGGGDKDRGILISRETIEIDEVLGHLLLGYAYRLSEEIELAIQEYRLVLDLDPANGRAHSGLGYCYLEQEEFEEAEASLAKAIEVDPDTASRYEAMAYYWSQREAREEEAENQESALRLKPLLSDVRYELARNYEKRELDAQAIHHYVTLIALTPEHHKAGDSRKRLKKLRKS